MDVTKINTQIRAEIGWLWQRETDDDVQTDSGAVRFKTYKTDIADGRLEGVWHAQGERSISAFSTFAVCWLSIADRESWSFSLASHAVFRVRGKADSELTSSRQAARFSYPPAIRHGK